MDRQSKQAQWVDGRPYKTYRSLSTGNAGSGHLWHIEEEEDDSGEDTEFEIEHEVKEGEDEDEWIESEEIEQEIEPEELSQSDMYEDADDSSSSDEEKMGENYIRPIGITFTMSDCDSTDDCGNNSNSDNDDGDDDEADNPAAWFKQRHLRRRTLTEELDIGLSRTNSSASLRRNSSNVSSLVDDIHTVRKRRIRQGRADSDPGAEYSVGSGSYFYGYSVSIQQWVIIMTILGMPSARYYFLIMGWDVEVYL